MAGDSRLWVASANSGLRLLSSSVFFFHYLISGLMIPPLCKTASHNNQFCTKSINPTINSPADSTSNLHPASSPDQIHDAQNAAQGRDEETGS